MAFVVTDSTRAPVAFGLRAVPKLFEELQPPDPDRRLRALGSLCDLMHDPERLYQTVHGGFLEQLQVLLKDDDPSVRTKTCELLHLLTGHSIGRQALLSSCLLPPLSLLLGDSSPSCRRNVHLVLNRLALLPAGAQALLSLVPKLMQKLREEEEEEEVQVLLLSTLSRCSQLDAQPALTSDGASTSPSCLFVVLSAGLSVPEDGKQQVCEGAVLPVLVGLLQDEDLEVQANAAGVIMYTVMITAGKQQCLDLGIISVLLDLVKRNEEEEKEKKALIMYSLRALTALAEAPDGRRLLLEQLPLLVKRSEAGERDPDIRRAAQTAVRVITWTP
uniref:Radial spoke head 14 homolog n=1 Tax=Mastacembelus armatus TaxID=205130 RepID=A0A3Q3MWW7_9TELE